MLYREFVKWQKLRVSIYGNHPYALGFQLYGSIKGSVVPESLVTRYLDAQPPFTMSALRSLFLLSGLLVGLWAHGQDCYDLSGNSSWISLACHYDDGRMLIRMQGNDYVFCGVPSSIFNGLIRADSPGEYYQAYIKGRYSCY